ncbi:elongator complex protein 5 [Cryptococcus deuterogattii 99/473]|uniref:Elongator complex protein 5 n=1 Tax=Cryptococcus deuterogattii Ram5 TaxID=1296110 RepID=A0A0D0USY2_9TREE|nr:elongator complex protein 5 [Cryptococcus deuterogattii Ram5]KIY58111.1 elongator complex protein 5 [Cryptococcus deuterogattii 99/473]
MPKGTASSLLAHILDNTQIPHQPLLILRDEPTFPATPIFNYLLTAAVSRNEPVTLVTVLNAPEEYLDPSLLPRDGINIIDLSGDVPGYTSNLSFQEIKQLILSSYKGGQIFIDALHVLGEDYSFAGVISLVRSLLASIKTHKAPSRLILPLPPSLLHHFTSPTLSPTLSLLSPLPLPLLTHLSKLYLSPISSNPSANYWMVMENAMKRGVGRELAYKGEEGLEVGARDWEEGVGVSVSVRKATGGIKGISRSLEAVVLTPPSQPSSSPTHLQLTLPPLSSLINLTPFSLPPPSAIPLDASAHGYPSQAATHADLDLPFNLSLTDSQRQARAQVPLPYAHEGEGASGDLVWEDEEESDDEEI